MASGSVPECRAYDQTSGSQSSRPEANDGFVEKKHDLPFFIPTIPLFHVGRREITRPERNYIPEQPDRF